ncbi:MAG: prolipoprotein diacylglyceryl transferase, partial [Bacteroidales bacterium]|nr:prolipoprotein diacylglyceryl transferase [Bacteroidales bacterium]
MFNLLYVTWDVNPILVQLGPLAIRYYSLLFVAGFPLGYLMVAKMYKRENKNTDLLEPLLYALLLGTIVGARLGHCLFYEPEYYLKNPVEILKVWHGGLASHGGAIGVLLAIWWYASRYGKKNNFDFMWLLDRL